MNIRKTLSAVLLAAILLSGPASAQNIAPGRNPDPTIKAPGCSEPDEPKEPKPPLEPGSSEEDEQPNGENCPPTPAPPPPPLPKVPPEPGPNPTPYCGMPGSDYSFNPTDAPDSLPTLGERVWLEAVFGLGGQMARWGRQIDFSDYARLNYLAKAHVTTDYQYIRIGDPRNASVATFERVGAGWTYRPLYAIGYGEDTTVTLENFENSIPGLLVVRYPGGASVTMEFETDHPGQMDIDGFVYRVVERRTMEGYAVTVAYDEEQVVITDASGNEYVCVLKNNKITEIYFIVDGIKRSWEYECSSPGLGIPYIIERNKQTGMSIANYLAGSLALSKVKTTGMDSSKFDVYYRPVHWRLNGVTLPFRRTVAPSSATFTGRGASAASGGSGKGTASGHAFGVMGKTRETKASGQMATWERNPQGLWVEKKDFLGNIWLRDYDGNRKLRSKQDPDGARVEYVYDANGDPVTARVKASDDRWVEYGYRYDAKHNLVVVLHPEGGETRYVRNGDGKITHRLEKASADAWSATAYRYNGRGQMVAASKPYFAADLANPDLGRGGDALVIAYDAWGNQIARTDAAGRTSRYEWSEGNKLVAVTDREGNTTRYAYDGIGRLTSRTDPNGHVTKWKYDIQSRIAEITSGGDAAGCSSCASSSAGADKPGKYTYDNWGNRLTYVDPEGNILRYTYDNDSRLIKSVDAAGGETTYEYDAADRLVRVVDPAGNETRHTRDAVGRVVATTRGGVTSRTEYDLRGKITAVFDGAGGETRMRYDDRGNLVSIRVKTDAAAWRERRLAYDLRGQLVETVDGYGTPDALVTRFTRDSAGRAYLTTVDPDGLALETIRAYSSEDQLVAVLDGNYNGVDYAYDRNGNLTAAVTQEGRRTAYEYDEMGRVVMTRLDPQGIDQFQATVYDPAGRVLEVSDGLAAVSYDYDSRGNRTRVAVPGRRPVLMAYDGDGRLVSQTRRSADGTLTLQSRIEYDEAGRVAARFDEAGNATTYTYNALGLPHTVTDPENGVTTFFYDAAGRQSRVVLPDGQERRYFYNLAGDLLRSEGGPEGTLTYQYDGLGRQTVVTDANGRTRRIAYDGAGRVASLSNEMNQTVVYGYDAAGNRTSLTDAKGNRSTFVYDDDNNLVELRYPGVPGEPENVERYAYDAAGRLVCKTTPNGAEVRVLYTNGGRVEAVYRGDEVADAASIPSDRLLVKYGYDGAGGMVREENPDTAIVYSYDQFGRLSGVGDEAAQKVVRYAYDARDLRSAMRVVDYATNPGGLVQMLVAYGYDNAGRLVSVKKDDDPAATYLYDASGRRSGLTLPNGVYTAYTYDSADRLTELITKRDQETLARFAYAIDPTGNRTGITYADGSKSFYEFDGAYRLTRDLREASDGAVEYDERYTYDSVGNRLTKVRTGWNPVNVQYQYNARNQLVSTTGTEVKTYRYDKDGALVSTQSTNGDEIWTYDVLGRLVRYEGPEGVEETTYIGIGWKRRTVVTTPTGGVAKSVLFLYDGDNVVADYSQGVLVNAYVTPGLDENLSLTRFTGSIGATYYYSHDALGSVRSFAGIDAVHIEYYDYTVFGEPISHFHSNVILHGYTGRDRSIISGRYNLRFRNYNPINGIFEQRDPLIYVGNKFSSFYSYVSARPNYFWDPMGLTEELRIYWDAWNWEYNSTLHKLSRVCDTLPPKDPCNVTNANKEDCLEVAKFLASLYAQELLKQRIAAFGPAVLWSTVSLDWLGNAKTFSLFGEYSGRPSNDPTGWQRGIYWGCVDLQEGIYSKFNNSHALSKLGPYFQVGLDNDGVHKWIRFTFNQNPSIGTWATTGWETGLPSIVNDSDYSRFTPLNREDLRK